MEALASRLAALIEPRSGGPSRPGPIPARGIESLIYRCPECLAFDAIRSGRGGGFRCSRCQARFVLLSDLSVVEPDGIGRGSLEDLSRRIRMASVSGGPTFVTGSGPGPAAGELAVEKGDRFESSSAGRMELAPEEVVFGAPGGVTRIGLGTIRAVNVEGARRLQIYGGEPPGLFQFTPRGQSALKWQDLIVGAVRRRTGTFPSTA